MKKFIIGILITVGINYNLYSQGMPPPSFSTLPKINSLSSDTGFEGSSIKIIGENLQSTDIVKFGIISGSENTVKIGTGSNSNTESTPFNANFGGHKTVSLYTVAELNSLGLSENSTITKIGYKIIGGDPSLLNNFKIRILNYDEATIGTDFSPFYLMGGTFIGYNNATYTPAISNEKIEIELDAPFIWNGYSNIVVETCFNNNSTGSGTNTILNVESTPISDSCLYAQENSSYSFCEDYSSAIISNLRPNLYINFFDWSGGTIANNLGNDLDNNIDVVVPNSISGKILIDKDGLGYEFAISKEDFNFIQPTKIVSTQCGRYISDLNSLIYCFISPNAQGYKFEVTENGAARTYESTTNKFKLTDLVGGAEYGKTYSIRVSIKYNEVWGAYGDACQVSTPSGPPTKLVSSQCGVTLSAVNTTLYCNKITSAEAYKFEVTLNGVVNTIENTTNSFSLTNLSNVNYNATYAIRVAAKYNGVWGQYNGVCNVTTPSAPGTTKLVTAQCGVSISAVNTTLFAYIVQGAQGYVFEATNAGVTRTYESLDNKFNLDNLTGGGEYGKTYTIRVKVRYNSTLFTSYGASCIVTTPSAPPTTKLVTSQCGVTLSVINTTLYANLVSGVQGYRFQATLSGVSRTFDSTTNKFSLTDLTGANNYGATYSVKVAVKLNNVWGPYGSACNVTTPSAVPSTKLVTSQCGITLTSLNQTIYANLVAGAQGYIFQVTEGITTRTFESNTNKFTLGDLSGGGEYGKTYSIKVAVRYNTTGLVSAFGTSCNITTPNASGKSALEEVIETTTIYPNPYSESFKIAFSSEEETNVQVFIYDASGRLVSQKEITSANLDNDEFGQGLSTGVYTVQVQQGEQIQILRVVKQ